MWMLAPLVLSPYSWLVVLAVLPAIVLMVYVYRHDRLEKEPGGLLFVLVLLGILSTLCAGFTESIGDGILIQFCDSGTKLYNVLLYFVVVGLSEEGFKYLFLRLKTWRNPNFNCQFDGVVYAVFVSLGFALAENISYVLSYGFTTALVRAVTSIPGHACFGVFMGVWYGQAKRCWDYGRPGESRTMRWLAVIIPALIHGAYDYLATDMETGSSMLFFVFLIALFVLSFLRVKKLSATDEYI